MATGRLPGIDVGGRGGVREAVSQSRNLPLRSQNNWVVHGLQLVSSLVFSGSMPCLLYWAGSVDLSEARETGPSLTIFGSYWAGMDRYNLPSIDRDELGPDV